MTHAQRRQKIRASKLWKPILGWTFLIVIVWGALDRLNLLNWLTG